MALTGLATVLEQVQFFGTPRARRNPISSHRGLIGSCRARVNCSGRVRGDAAERRLVLARLCRMVRSRRGTCAPHALDAGF
jgi:hypothetical protein